MFLFNFTPGPEYGAFNFKVLLVYQLVGFSPQFYPWIRIRWFQFQGLIGLPASRCFSSILPLEPNFNFKVLLVTSYSVFLLYFPPGTEFQFQGFVGYQLFGVFLQFYPWIRIRWIPIEFFHLEFQGFVGLLASRCFSSKW